MQPNFNNFIWEGVLIKLIKKFSHLFLIIIIIFSFTVNSFAEISNQNILKSYSYSNAETPNISPRIGQSDIGLMAMGDTVRLKCFGFDTDEVKIEGEIL